MTSVQEQSPAAAELLKIANSTQKETESPIVLNSIRSLSPSSSRRDSTSDSHNDGREVKSKSPRYGWCSFTPNFIQFLVNRKAFLFVFCVTCVLQGTFHTYFVAVITTLEKLFSIPSQVTGTLMMGSEIGQVGSALFLPYFVGQGHRPRWMAIGSSLFSLATLLCASPHVLIPLSLTLIKSTQDSQYCDAAIFSNSTEAPETCVPGEEQEQNPHFILFPIIFLSLLTIGLGQTAVYTLGIPFLDDNIASRDSPIYFSITIGVRILGPVLGFILGSLCTRLYIYPTIKPEYDPTDPRWLGAWWLGMLLISSSLFVASILMYGFPSSLRKRKVLADVDDREEARPIRGANSNSSSNTRETTAVANQEQQQPKLKHFPRTLKRLLSNKILILRTFSCVFHLLPISGLYTFLPKYLESQFRLAAFQANMITGIAGILVMGIGIFSSGVFIRRREPSARGIALWVAGAAGVYAVGMVVLMFIGCGVSSGGTHIGSTEASLKDFSIREDENFGLPNCETNKCEKCLESIYSPVCGSDNLVYFSPCHAGCSKMDAVKTDLKGGEGKKITYSNCTCVGSSNYGSDGEFGEQTATNGLCPVSCDLFPLYLTIFMIIVLVHSTSEVGSMLLTLRCVDPKDKAMALGLMQCAIGIFGNIPCPVIYGTVVDSACIVWGLSGGKGSENCMSESENVIDGAKSAAKRGHCWVYDSSSFRVYFHGTTAFLMFIAFLIDIVIVFHANAINMNTNEEEDERNKDGDNTLNRNQLIKLSSSASPNIMQTGAAASANRVSNDDDDDDEMIAAPSKLESSPLLDGNRRLGNGAVIVSKSKLAESS